MSMKPTTEGRNFINNNPVFGEILRATLQRSVEAGVSYGFAYMTWACKAAAYLAWTGDLTAAPPVKYGVETDAGECMAATPELRTFAGEQRDAIEKALAPYMAELDAAPLKVLTDEELNAEIERWSVKAA